MEMSGRNSHMETLDLTGEQMSEIIQNFIIALCCIFKSKVLETLEIDECVCECPCAIVSNSAIPQTVTCQASLSMGFPSQEYQSGLPFLSPRDLPIPGIKPVSLVSPELEGKLFTTSATWETRLITKTLSTVWYLLKI